MAEEGNQDGTSETPEAVPFVCLNTGNQHHVNNVDGLHPFDVGTTSAEADLMLCVQRLNPAADCCIQGA